MTEQAASSGGSARHGAGRIAWQLLLTLWVGAVWSLHFILLPGLQHMAGAFFGFRLQPNPLYGIFCYLVVAFAGLVLAVQPRPDEVRG